jgi:transposase
MDIQKQLFSTALGVSTPIYIDEIEFNADRELHIYLDFHKGAEFPCPKCGEMHKAYDTTEKVWRHLNFFQYKSFLHFFNPRIDCPNCGISQYTPIWAREKSGFTLLFEAFVIMLFKGGFPLTEIEKMTGVDDRRLRRTVDFHIEKAYKMQDFSDVKSIGIDETSSKKGHKYVTVFTNQKNGKVIFATEGKDAETIATFVEKSKKNNLKAEQIEEVSMDMSQSFQKGVTENLPNANITFDRFHVVKMLNDAVDEVRKMEQNSDSKLKKILKNSRYVWLKNPENLTDKQAELLETLSNSNLTTAEAYRLKLNFQDIYEYSKDEKTAENALLAWCESVEKSCIQPLIDFTKTLKKHLTGVLRFFKSRITNGISEGLNSVIGQVKRRARGYSNMRHFINTIYLVCGGLVLPNIHDFL